MCLPITPDHTVSECASGKLHADTSLLQGDTMQEQCSTAEPHALYAEPVLGFTEDAVKLVKGRLGPDDEATQVSTGSQLHTSHETV